jgi:hypothetical protein
LLVEKRSEHAELSVANPTNAAARAGTVALER